MQIALPYPPSVNRLWRSGAGRRVYKSPAAAEWAGRAAWIVKQSGVRVDGPFVLLAMAHRPDKRRRDLDNLLKAVLDALQAGGAIRDDADCQAVTIQWAGVGVSLQSHGPTKGLPHLSVILGEAAR